MEGTSVSMAGGVAMQKLGRENYHAWKFNAKMVLIGKDLWDLVTGDEILPEEASEATRKAFRKKDNRALSCICLAISEDLQIYVRNAKSSKEAWDSLANHFEEKTLSKKIYYRRKLYATRMDDGSSMIEHVNKIKTIAEHLEALDDMVVEKDLVMILISSLPDDFNNLITTLETLKEEKLSWDYVRDRVITEFERKKGEKQQVKGPQDALFVGGGGQQGITGNGNKFNNKNSNNKFDKKTKFKCHYCHETGHFIKDCEKRKLSEEKAKEREKQKEEEHTTFCRTERRSSDFHPEFVLHVDDHKTKQARWLLDSACSKHMTGEKGDLDDYKEFDKENDDESQCVTLADKSVVRAVGQGCLNIYLRDINGRKVPVTFKNVLYVPNFERLISVSQLTKRGAEVVFKEKSVELRMGERCFEFGSKLGKLFKMNWCYYAHSNFEETNILSTEINNSTTSEVKPEILFNEEKPTEGQIAVDKGEEITSKELEPSESAVHQVFIEEINLSEAKFTNKEEHELNIRNSFTCIKEAKAVFKKMF